MDYKDRIDENNENIKMLLESINIKNRKLVIFAGAGVSALCGLPLWNNFARKLVDDCFEDNYISYYEKEEYYSQVIKDSKLSITLIYNIYSKKRKKDKFHIHFQEHLNKDDTNKKNMVVSALKKMRASIITTNADKILDNCAFDEENIYFGNRILEIDVRNFGQNRPEVVHIHGSIDDRESLVFTVDQYLKQYGNTNDSNIKLQQKIKSLLNSPYNTLLFVGSSMSEMELLQYIISDGSNLCLENRFILNGFYTHQKELEQTMRDYYLNFFGLRQISYSMNQYGYDNIIKFLEDLADMLFGGEKKVVELYEEIHLAIQEKNTNQIIKIIKQRSSEVSSDLLSEILKEINQSPLAIDVYTTLYAIKKEYFDISKNDYNKNMIQFKILDSVASIENKEENEKFKVFINAYIKRIERAIKQKEYSLEKNYIVIFDYVQIIKMNISKNEKKLYNLIELLIRNKLDYFNYIISEISQLTLSSKTAFKIAECIFESDIIKENNCESYGIDKYLSSKLNQIMTYNSVAFFKVLRKKVLESAENEALAYFDMGALFDYIDKNSYMTYEKYYIKVLKMVIDNMSPSNANKAFQCCENKRGLDLKIKIYIIDKHFDFMKEKINRTLIDNIDAVASTCWLIKNHYNYICIDVKFKKKILKMIQNCNFFGEEEKDALALKYILSSLVEGFNYKLENKYNSKYEYTDFCNIGKQYWISNGNSEIEEEYKKIERKSVKEVLDYINSSLSNSIFSQSAVKKYFESKEKVEEILRNPNLFKSLKNENYYLYILDSVFKENSFDRGLIKKFIKTVYKRNFTKDNFWMLLEIIKQNDLLNDISFSIPVLEYIFEKVVKEKFDFPMQSEEIISNIISNIVYRCFVSLCQAHIVKNDVISFIKEKLNKYEKSPNYFLILSAVAAINVDIYMNNKEIEEIFDKIFEGENEEKKIIILNCAIFSGMFLIKKHLTKTLFEQVYSKLDKSAQNYYSNFIICNYMEFDLDFLQYVINHSTIDYVHIIDIYMKEKRGDLEKLVSILVEIVDKQGMNVYMYKQLLKLLCENPQCGELKKLCSRIAKIKFSYFDWKDLEETLKKIHSIDEKYAISKIFIPISERYLNGENLYFEKKYSEIFDVFYSLTKDQECLEEMKNIANKAFKRGLIEFAKYAKDNDLVKI